MSHKRIDQKHVTTLIICMMIGLLGLASCSKEPAAPEPAKTDDTKTSEQTKTPAAEPAPAAAGMVELKLDLPKPQFVGTPTNIEGISNLEKPRGKARPNILVHPVKCRRR